METANEYGRKGRESLNRLITKGFWLLTQKGVLAASLEDILRFCGMKKGSFYYYFVSKDEFVRVCFRECYSIPLLEATNAMFSQAGTSFADIDERMLQLLERLQREMDQRLGEDTFSLSKVYAQVMTLAEHGGDDIPVFFKDQNQKQIDWITETLRAMQTRGEIRPDIVCEDIAELIGRCWLANLVVWQHDGLYEELEMRWHKYTASFEYLLKV